MSNEAITDAVAQTNLLTIGLTSSNAAANLITATSQTLALAAHNAVANQQQGYITQQSASVQGRGSMMATGVSVASAVTKNI